VSDVSEDPSPDSEESQPRLEGARQLLSAGGLLLAVLVILALGAVLRVDPSQVPPPSPEAKLDETPSTPEETPSSPSDLAKAPDTTDTAPRETAPSEPLAVPEEAPATNRATGLPARAASDAASLARKNGAFTLQLLYACRDETVERFLKRSPGSSSMHLLLAVDKPNCYRVCWGSYGTAQEAQGAIAGIPARVREGVDPRPVKLAGLLP
jgi:septal ring-binding cell division protein DamX